jgi:hypothetical protein
MPGTLHHRPAGRGVAAHEQGDADDAVVAHDGDLGRSAVGHDVQQRDDRIDREIHVAQYATPDSYMRLAQRQGHQCQIRLQAFKFGLQVARLTGGYFGDSFAAEIGIS